MRRKLRIAECEQGKPKERQTKLAAILAEGIYRCLRRRGQLRDGRRKMGNERAAPEPTENGEVREGRTRLDFPADRSGNGDASEGEPLNGSSKMGYGKEQR